MTNVKVRVNRHKLFAICVAESVMRDKMIGLNALKLPTTDWMLAFINSLNPKHKVMLIV